jgi:hypothetical protein
MSYAVSIPMTSRQVDRYQPIDEILEHPRIRILRLLSRHDWLSGHEIAEELGVLWSPRIRNAYAAHLMRMRKIGMIVSRDPGAGSRSNWGNTFGTFGGPDYRIAPHAASDLPRIIDRAMRARR